MSERVAKFLAQKRPALGLFGAELKEAWEGDLQQLRDLVCAAAEKEADQGWVWCDALFEDRVVVSFEDGRLMEYPFTVDGSDVKLGEPREVVKSYDAAGDVSEMKEATGFTGHFLEAKGSGRFRIRVIEAGLSKNGNFYPEDVLREAVDLFEAARVFTKSDAEHLGRGGKDFKNLIGGLSDVDFVEAAAGQPAQIHADLALIDATIEAKLTEAWNEGLTGLFGFSIDAVASADTKRVGGRRVVEATKFREVKSVDLIIEPGAGGGIVNLKEAVGGPVMDRDQIVELLESSGADVSNVDQLTDDDLAARLKEAVAQAGKKSAKAADEAGVAMKEAVRDEQSFLTRDEFRLTEARREAVSQVQGSALPDAAKARLVARLTEARNADALAAAQVTQAIADEAAYLSGFVEAGKPVGLGVRAQSLETQGDKTAAMLEAFFDPGHKDHRHARSFKEAYVAMTGDSNVTGQDKHADQVVMREALSSGSFSSVLGDAIHRRLVQEYSRADQYSIWRQIADVVPTTDFRDQKRVRFGGYGDLPTVAEAANYAAVQSPGDEEASYAVAKRGGLETLTVEMIKNDDVGAIRRIPVRMAAAAKRTLAKFALDFVATNPTVYDGLSLFHQDHSNLGTAPLSAESLAAGRLAMLKQQEANSNDPLGIGPKSLLVPVGLEETAANMFRRKDNIDQTFVQSLALQIIPVWYWTSPTDWVLAADVNDIPGLEIGFLDGNEEPEVLVQDSPTVGSMFSHDTLTYKIRHIYGGAVLDYRAFYGARV